MPRLAMSSKSAPPEIVPVLLNVVMIPEFLSAGPLLEIVALLFNVVMVPDERIALPTPEIKPLPLFVRVVIEPVFPMPMAPSPEAVIEPLLVNVARVPLLLMP